MKILMVDDEADIRFVAKMMLGPSGHELAEAGSIAEAFEQLERSVPDVILLDIRLPDGDGVDALKRFRADERFADIPVVMLSAHSSPETVAEAMSQGSRDYVVKPFTEKQLMDTLHAVTGLAD